MNRTNPAAQAFDAKTLELLQLFKAMQDPAQAALKAADIFNQANSRVVTISATQMGTAVLETSPFEINFSFQSFLVLDATDSNVSVNFKMGARDGVNDAWPIKKGSALNLPFPVKKAYLHWSAQSGKTLTILFLFTGNFQSNALNLVNSGGVSISEGTSFTTTKFDIAAATATALFAQDTTRICGNWVNETGQIAFVGNSTVTSDSTNASYGRQVKPGESLTWKNSAALYVYFDSAATNLVKLEEF